MKPKLIVITGPTASGKTALAIWLAQQLDCEIVSADSRQIFKELRIGSAAPSEEELNAVPHHFVASRSITQPYNAGQFETEALLKLNELFKKNPVQILCGGSGMYIKAVIQGFDNLPETDMDYRMHLIKIFRDSGINVLQQMLKERDPDYYAKVDLMNPQRLIRALEVIEATGKAFSSLRQGKPKQRNFDILVLSTDLPRAQLYERINQRTLQMIEQGWIDECKALLPFRNHQALQTVGYKEIFLYLDRQLDLSECIRLIQRNTRRFAKRQLTYIKNQFQAQFIHPDNKQKFVELVSQFIQA